MAYHQQVGADGSSSTRIPLKGPGAWLRSSWLHQRALVVRLREKGQAARQLDTLNGQNARLVVAHPC